LDALRFTSFLVFVFVLFSLGVIVYYAINPSNIQFQALTGISSKVYFGFPGDVPQFLKVFALIGNAFASSQNVPTIVRNIVNPTNTRLLITFTSATGLCLLIYITSAIAGYVTFGETVDSDVLLSYPSGLIPVTIARLSISVAL